MNCSDFFSFNNVRKHGHNCTCQNADLTRVSLASLEEFALYWNNLPFDVVIAVSLNSFKPKLTNVCFIC